MIGSVRESVKHDRLDAIHSFSPFTGVLPVLILLNNFLKTNSGVPTIWTAT